MFEFQDKRFRFSNGQLSKVANQRASQGNWSGGGIGAGIHPGESLREWGP